MNRDLQALVRALALMPRAARSRLRREEFLQERECSTERRWGNAPELSGHSLAIDRPQLVERKEGILPLEAAGDAPGPGVARRTTSSPRPAFSSSGRGSRTPWELPMRTIRIFKIHLRDYMAITLGQRRQFRSSAGVTAG